MTEPLHIYHTLLSRGFAGSERSTAESCNAQCKDHQVTLILRKDHRKNGRSIVDHLDSRVTIKTISHHVFPRLKLDKLVQEDQPDVIHTHLRRSTRIVSKIQTHAAKIATLHIAINGKCFLKMDGLVCNARWQLEAVPANYTGKCHKANNSLSPHRRLSVAEIFELRSSLNISHEDILIGGVGRYHPSKAWDTLIKAFKQLPGYNNTKLHIFGSGNQEEQLKKLAADDNRIVLAGYRNDIKDLYQAFDILACPSRFDPLPRAILEAMDAGTPVIASDAGGCKELVNDYGGQLFECDNTESLTRTLATWLKSKPARHRPDLSAHHLENTNKAMINFYRELIAKKQHLSHTPSLATGKFENEQKGLKLTGSSRK